MKLDRAMLIGDSFAMANHRRFYGSKWDSMMVHFLPCARIQNVIEQLQSIIKQLEIFVHIGTNGIGRGSRGPAEKI